MNILHIITGLNDGGAEAVLFRLCSHDQENQHTVISMMDEGKYGPLLPDAGVEVHYLRMPRGLVTVAGLFRLWVLLRRLRPEVVQTWMYHADLLGGLVARLAGCSRVVWGIHHSNLGPGLSKGSTIMVAKACARFSRWIPAQIVVCAEQAARVHADLGYVADKMVVIANGYDVAHFQADPSLGQRLRAEWGFSGPVPLIGMVARFDPQKDHANLLMALGSLKKRGGEFRCALIGTGVDEANRHLIKLVAEQGVADNVRLLGRRDDIPAVMNALDLHVLSSAGEAFPNVLAEAMACGTPCVTTDVGDSSLIVGETGWVVQPGNSIALADAIDKAITQWQDQSSWQRRERSCRERIKAKFSLATMVAAYRDVWSLLV